MGNLYNMKHILKGHQNANCSYRYTTPTIIHRCHQNAHRLSKLGYYSKKGENNEATIVVVTAVVLIHNRLALTARILYIFCSPKLTHVDSISHFVLVTLLSIGVR